MLKSKGTVYSGINIVRFSPEMSVLLSGNGDLRGEEAEIICVDAEVEVGKRVEYRKVVLVNEVKEGTECSSLWDSHSVLYPFAVMSIESYRGAPIVEEAFDRLEETSVDEVFVFQFPEEYVVLHGVKCAGEVKEDRM